MAKISLNVLVSDVRNRLGNVVFSKWKKTNYVRQYVSYSREATPKQIEVRNAFSLLVSIWQSAGALMQRSWTSFAAGENMTGLNAFIGANYSRVIAGEPVELFKAMGEDPLSSLAQESSPANQIVCSFSFTGDMSEKHVIFFAQRVADGRLTDDILMADAGLNPVSPFAITGLESDANYIIYAVVADNDYANAAMVSAAVTVSATAGV